MGTPCQSARGPRTTPLPYCPPPCLPGAPDQQTRRRPPGWGQRTAPTQVGLADAASPDELQDQASGARPGGGNRVGAGRGRPGTPAPSRQSRRTGPAEQADHAHSNPTGGCSDPQRSPRTRQAGYALGEGSAGLGSGGPRPHPAFQVQWSARNPGCPRTWRRRSGAQRGHPPPGAGQRPSGPTGGRPAAHGMLRPRVGGTVAPGPVHYTLKVTCLLRHASYTTHLHVNRLYPPHGMAAVMFSPCCGCRPLHQVLATRAIHN